MIRLARNCIERMRFKNINIKGFGANSTRDLHNFSSYAALFCFNGRERCERRHVYSDALNDTRVGKSARRIEITVKLTTQLYPLQITARNHVFLIRERYKLFSRKAARVKIEESLEINARKDICYFHTKRKEIRNISVLKKSRVVKLLSPELNRRYAKSITTYADQSRTPTARGVLFLATGVINYATLAHKPNIIHAKIINWKSIFLATNIHSHCTISLYTEYRPVLYMCIICFKYRSFSRQEIDSVREDLGEDSRPLR
ncbi:hypothetical protein PUN28_010997 [Cardiocondyla obscurior]|uniref:Uncharacterized protein n=1 Tax=Cardiocondyla obscurior TaxID=286306 RepID=A0AAW2FNW9_9HYME